MKKTLIYILLAATFAGCARCPASTDAPLIGISSGTDGYNVSLGGNYPVAVAKAGGIPVVIPVIKDEQAAQMLMSRLDGLILSGGEDVNPAYYGEEVLNASVSFNAVRDTSDFLLIKAAHSQGKPILGICRGHQIVNVAFGGSLYQDIPTQIGTEHRQNVSGIPRHKVGLEPGSRIRSLLGDADSVSTNSHHHQSVKEPAPGFSVTARAADGVVEASEGPGAFCVQFHPEALVADGEESFLAIFTAFIEDCRR